MFQLKLKTMPRILGKLGLLAMLSLWVLQGCALNSLNHQTPPAAYDAQYKISEFMLSNGAKLVVKEDHRGPVVITQFWYRVGSSDEPNGITGVSHALEHMMFKGTEAYSGDKLTETIKLKGGQYNAFTGPDYTAYYEVFEASNMELSFSIESDRMVNLLMREEDFIKEIEVVKEERRLRVSDNAQSQMWERLYALAFRNTPYGNPVIGWMDDLDSMTLDDLKDWYQKWYTPSNLTILVAGDVDPAEAYRLAQKYVEPIPARPIPSRKPRREISTESELRFKLKAVAEKPYLMMANRVPNSNTAEHAWEPFALSVLGGILSGSSSSRFPINLVRGKKVARSVSAAYNQYSLYDDLFVVVGTPLDGVTVAQLEEDIEQELEIIKKHGVKQDELEIIKTRMLASQVYGRDSLTRQAYQLGQFETLGLGWRALYDQIDHLKAVTPEQVQAVAKKYLNKDTRIVGELLPQSPTKELAKELAK